MISHKLGCVVKKNGKGCSYYFEQITIISLENCIIYICFSSFFNHIFDTSYSNGVSVLFENQNEFTSIFNSFIWKSKIVPHLSDSNNLSPNFFLYTQSVSPRHAHTKSAIFSFVPLCSPLCCLLLRTTVFSFALSSSPPHKHCSPHCLLHGVFSSTSSHPLRK